MKSDITIREIELGIIALQPDLEGNILQLRQMAMLLAILKCGPKRQELSEFTHYNAKVIGDVIDELTQHRLLLTGAISPQFILQQMPGSRDLIERVSGPVVREVAPMVKKPIEDVSDDVAEMCGCGILLPHKGRCWFRRGDAGPSQKSRGPAAKVAREKKQIARRPLKPSRQIGVVPKVAPMLKTEEALSEPVATARLEMEFRQNGNHFVLKVEGAEYIKRALAITNGFFEAADK